VKEEGAGTCDTDLPHVIWPPAPSKPSITTRFVQNSMVKVSSQFCILTLLEVENQPAQRPQTLTA
jgi:hypothetical protein